MAVDQQVSALDLTMDRNSHMVRFFCFNEYIMWDLQLLQLQDTK